MRVLACSRSILVAAPFVAAQIEGETEPDCLTRIPSVAFGVDDAPDAWRLMGPNHSKKVLHLSPRLTCVELASSAQRP